MYHGKRYLILAQESIVFNGKCLMRELSLFAILQVHNHKKIVVVVCLGLTSLSTIFQSDHDRVWLRQGAQCSLL